MLSLTFCRFFVSHSLNSRKYLSSPHFACNRASTGSLEVVYSRAQTMLAPQNTHAVWNGTGELVLELSQGSHPYYESFGLEVHTELQQVWGHAESAWGVTEIKQNQM